MIDNDNDVARNQSVRAQNIRKLCYLETSIPSTLATARQSCVDQSGALPPDFTPYPTHPPPPVPYPALYRPTGIQFCKSAGFSGTNLRVNIHVNEVNRLGGEVLLEMHGFPGSSFSRRNFGEKPAIHHLWLQLRLSDSLETGLGTQAARTRLQLRLSDSLETGLDTGC